MNRALDDVPTTSAAEGTVGEDALNVRSAWGDAGYFRGRSRLRNGLRLLWQLFSPPRGHRIRITKPGALLILVSFGIGTAAFNTSQNILYLVLSLMLSTLLLSGLLSWMNFKGLRWRLSADSHFRVGREAGVRVEVSNTKQRLPSYSVRFELGCEPETVRSSLWLGQRLNPGASQVLEWWWRPRRRGVSKVKLEGVVSQFPFGFLRKTILESCVCEVVVWPARLSYNFTPPSRGRMMVGAGRQRRRGGGNELLKIRDYRVGDPLRQVHWKASARRGQLLVRENTEENDQAYCLRVESSPDLWPDAEQFERMCAFAGSLAEDLFVRGRLAGMIIDGDFLPAQRMQDLETIFEAVSRMVRGGVPRPRGVEAVALPSWPMIEFRPGAGGAVNCELEGVHAGSA